MRRLLSPLVLSAVVLSAALLVSYALMTRRGGRSVPTVATSGVWAGAPTPASEAAAVAPYSEGVVAFVNVNVIPMDRNTVLPAQTVLVRDGHIAAVGPAGEVPVPEGAQRIDGRGRYLLPGLADLHVHLKWSGEADNRAILRLFVLNGVTTVLNLAGTPHHLDLRRRLRSGELFGPLLYTGGPFISDAPRWTPTPEEVEQSVVEQKKAGYDFIKIHGDFPREAYRRLFEVSRREGMRVIGHAPRNLGLEPMLEEKQDAVAHAEEFLEAYFFHEFSRMSLGDTREAKERAVVELTRLVPSLSERVADAGLWVIPNLTAYKNIGEQVEDLDAVLARPEVRYMVPEIAPWWLPEQNTYRQRFPRERAWFFRAQYGLLEKTVKGFRDAGVRMLAGTDALNPCVVPGFSLHEELRNLVAAGLTPFEALQTATVNVAEFFGTPGEFGVVRAGARADLLLVERNPLEDIGNTARISGVMVRGRWLSEGELEAQRAALKGSAGGDSD
ncbi:MAG: amidohydrolase family protein [Acidobacteria bacterium]|nr:amidohydrolase family protein [Acidobacteriota bacterium]